jgi:hypothetical protein
MVLQILHTSDFDVTPTTDEQFLELLCANEDLLRDEFDAIIAAEWPSPPPAEPDHGTRAKRGPRRGRHRREANATRLPNQPRHPGIGRWARQRSPPPAAATTGDRKAGDATRESITR